MMDELNAHDIFRGEWKMTRLTAYDRHNKVINVVEFTREAAGWRRFYKRWLKGDQCCCRVKVQHITY